MDPPKQETQQGWSWYGICAALLGVSAPLGTYLAFWGTIGIGHGPASGAFTQFYAGLAICIGSGVLGALALSSRRRGRWLGVIGLLAALAALFVIGALLLEA